MPQNFNLQDLPKAFTSPRKLVSPDGVPLAYWQEGNAQGPAIVFLHGFGLDHSVWVNQFADAALRAKYRLIAPDLRGHGASGRPNQQQALTASRPWADDLAAIMKVCELETPVIVAWSYAGRMVNDYLKYFPQSTLGGINYVAAATLAYGPAIGPGHAILADMCAEDDATRSAACNRFIDGIFGAGADTEEFHTLSRTIGSTSQRDRAWLRSRPLDYDQILADLSIPVLISHGMQDQFVLPSLATQLQHVLAAGRLSLYPGAGHAPFLECPERFNAELQAFIEQPKN